MLTNKQKYECVALSHIAHQFAAYTNWPLQRSPRTVNFFVICDLLVLFVYHVFSLSLLLPAIMFAICCCVAFAIRIDGFQANAVETVANSLLYHL